VTRFGQVIGDRSAPIGPGLHFKTPLDSVDKLQVTLQTVHIPAFNVLTVDNQQVAIEENFNFTIAPKDVYHVLYEVGRAGNIDLHEQVIPVAHDRTARVFASQNMVTVNQNRDHIQQQIEASVTKSVEDLFGITPHSLQIAAITPSPGFMKSIDAATMAKNEAIAAENQLRTKQFQAQQVAASAKGEADAAIEQARGQAEAVRLNAEAEKSRLELQGLGLKSNLAEQIAPFGSPEKFVAYIEAKAKLQWDGKLPTTFVPGSAVPFMNLSPPTQLPSK